MRYLLSFTLLLLVSFSFAQEQPATPKPEEKAVDVIGQQAAALEAELGKFKDNTPEAAEAMVKLVDLYHKDGRLFGLVRVGQQFAGSHATDPRHKAVMLKLIDGLEAISRNKDLSAACRQFLARYEGQPECPDVEIRLANAMNQLEDRARAADACMAVWKRQGPNEIGRRYGALAVQQYSLANTGETITAAAELGDEMLEKLPAGEFAKELGHHSFWEWRRIGQWAKATAVGTKLLAKNLIGDNEAQRQFHLYMAENQANLSQHANSAESFRKARAIRDDQLVHFNLVFRLYHAGAKPAEMEALVNEYVAKYPTRPDRFHLQSYLAISLLTNGDKPRALQIFASLLADDPATNGNASYFARENGSEPAQIADSEAKLLAAISQKKEGVYYLRYVLATEIYRDRYKDMVQGKAKAKQMFRELVSQSPTDDAHTSNAIDYLLYNAASDDEFKGDLALIFAARAQYPHLATFRDMVKSWATAARQNKDHAAHAALAMEEYKKAATDPLTTAFAEQRNNQYGPGEAIRNNLLDAATFDKLNDSAARYLLTTQMEWFRHYSPANKRGEMIRVYALWCKRFPTEFPAAFGWLESATDYGKPEDCKAAAVNFLKFEPLSNNPDIWRRLLIAADKNSDADMAKQAHAWMTKAIAKFGNDPVYGSGIGDMLLKYQLETEAVAHWTACVALNRQYSESRECALRLITRLKTPAERLPVITELLKHDTDFFGRYTQWLADDYFKAGDFANFERVLKEARVRQNERPLRPWDMDIWVANQWFDAIRANAELKEDVKQKFYATLAAVEIYPASGGAAMAILETLPEDPANKTKRLLELQKITRLVGNEYYDWDRLSPFAQNAVTRRDFVAAAVLSTGMLANIPNVDEPRKKAARDLATQSFARLGSVGLTIDENSPLAPLMQAALYYRLGDERLAFDSYLNNKALFDANRNQLPPDFLMFICDRLMAASGDANHEAVEEILRGWLVEFSESMQVDANTKAKMQLGLAKNFFKAQRYDIARSEYTTVVNRYPMTPQAIEAEFGIGETFMAQKVYDQAELVFEKLSHNPEIDVVVRAEFLRGVLAFRRGDRDEARDIFKAVLERVPSVELANQALYNLAEVYGSEEKYIDQLNLLRTVGRLGRASKRRHVPGMPLSIVVHDSDLGISRGHNRIPVRVTTQPGGDSELVYLTGSGAGKGLFRVDLETRLGQAVPGDHVLQVTGNDVIKSDYPEEFKAEFKSVPLSDVEIQVAADAKFEVASSKIEDRKQESFSEILQREVIDEENQDRRRSLVRPANQIKPGNEIYLRVKDGDRDLTNDADKIVVKLTADSGDQVQVTLLETGSHTGVFEGTSKTGELPAGALASDNAIDHNPLMAIDRDFKTFWMSDPDGATPKQLTVDMKDLRIATRVRISTPDVSKNAPVRGDLYGSQDGEFWFRIASHPERPPAAPVTGVYGKMSQRVYAGNLTGYTTWQQVADFSKNAKPIAESESEHLQFVWKEEDENYNKPFAVIWNGKFVQPRDGAVRIQVNAATTALAIDNREELQLGPGGRTVDLWLDAGTHDLAIFAAHADGKLPVEALLARSDLNNAQVQLGPFRPLDFDLESAAAKKRAASAPMTGGAGSVPLLITSAKLSKKSEKFGPVKENGRDVLAGWAAPEDSASWEFDAPTVGAYEVWMQFSHAGAGGSYNLEFGKQIVAGAVPDTGGWDKPVLEKVGTILVETAGRQTLALKAVEIKGEGLLNLYGITLKPAVAGSVIVANNDWEFRFPARQLRYTRFVCREYLGEALAINNVEIGGVRPGEVFIPTKEDVLGLAANNVLEIAAGDTVTATYTDELTLSDSGASQILTGKLQATYFNANVRPIAYDFARTTAGDVYTIRKDLKRVEPGDRFIVEVLDYDEDRTNQRDTLKLQVVVNDGEPVELEAIETEEYSGIFTKEVDTSAKQEKDKLMVKPGDRIYVRYIDTHNTFPGHAVPREDVVYVNQPSQGRIRILETRVIPAPPDSKQPPQITVLPTAGKEISGVAFEAPLTVEVIDPDAAKDSLSTVPVLLTTSDGSTVEVNCAISTQFSPNGAVPNERWALEEGRFVGQVILQLGGKNSPAVVPLTTSMPRNLLGKVKLGEGAEEQTAGANLVTRVLNLTGKDVINAAYNDVKRPDGKAQKLNSKGRLISNGVLVVTDRDYDKEITQLHVGEKLFIKVTDADLDSSDARDVASVEITSDMGEKETVRLEETLAHSGIFTGSLQLKAVDKPKAGNLDSADPVIETYFGDNLIVRYLDPSASTESGKLELTSRLPVVVGTDGLVAAFSKTFGDENLAVETKFRMAESYFELFKSHKSLQRDDEKKIDLEAGRRILREVMEDYPDPKYAPRIAYLLGQFAQELEQWDEAIRSYDLIITQYPDHTLAPDAQYKLAQSYEEAGDFDQALEAYVTLAATYPKSPLIPNVMIRISDYFYKHERYQVAAQVGEKFLERFQTHQHAPKLAFRVGQCYYKSKKYAVAGKSFDQFAKLFPDDALCADALFWSGESFRLGGNNSEAFRRYNRCRWDYPSSEGAKYARGRLALPEMLQQFEAEANSVDDNK